jgi:hypothetical protein
VFSKLRGLSAENQAARGGEPSGATAGWRQAGQDRGATLASRVGEFLAGADSGGEEGVEGKVSESSAGKTALSGCRGPNHRENGCLPRSLRGSGPSPTDDCSLRRSDMCYRSGGKFIMEIPVHSPAPAQVVAEGRLLKQKTWCK